MSRSAIIALIPRFDGSSALGADILEADHHLAARLESAAPIFSLRDRPDVISVSPIVQDHRIETAERIVFQRRQGCFRYGTTHNQSAVGRKQTEQPLLGVKGDAIGFESQHHGGPPQDISALLAS